MFKSFNKIKLLLSAILKYGFLSPHKDSSVFFIDAARLAVVKLLPLKVASSSIINFPDIKS